MNKVASRLGFTIPEFVRTVWISQDAKDYWEPKIQAINRCWPEIERVSVAHGMRQGALQSLNPEDLPAVQNWAFANNIEFVIVAMEGAPVSYGNASTPYIQGRPFQYRAYIGNNARSFKDAWDHGDNLAIGEHLGFPECCVHFFDNYWREEGWRDLTYPMIEFNNIELPNLTYNNVLLKHIGVRPVFHLPCSFLCKSSCEIGVKNYNLMDVLGFEKEARWSRELVSMPMEWSSLHGVAILTTPIFKIVYSSDALQGRAYLKLCSDSYPEQGKVSRLILNGFKTLDGMQNAHNFVLDSLPKSLSGRVLDLGCGDGELLYLIRSKYDTLSYGVDLNEEVVEQAARNAREGDIFSVCDIYDWYWEAFFDLTLIALQRLLEVKKDAADELLNRIAKHSMKVFVYSYAGWTNSVDDLLAKHFDILSVHRDTTLNCEGVLLGRKNPNTTLQ